MATNTDTAFDRNLARIAVGAYDDAQEVRVAMMNRVRDVVRKRNEGIPFDEVEDEKDPEERDYDAKYQDDNLPELIEEMVAEGKLTDEEYGYLERMLSAGETMQMLEDQYQDVMEVTKNDPIWTEWLQHVTGIAHTLTARLLHTYGYCEEFEKVSNLWSYSGLAPGQRPKRGEKLGYNPQAKTLAWLAADRMIMQGDNSRYKTEFYDPYKAEQVHRMEESECPHCGEPSTEHVTVDGEDGRHCPDDPDTVVGSSDFDLPDGAPEEATPPWSQGHADARARRYMAKKLLKHYWAVSRDIAGEPVPDEYILTHGGHDKRTDTFENPFYAKEQLQAEG